jgi:hypothetical protein
MKKLPLLATTPNRDDVPQFKPGDEVRLGWGINDAALEIDGA